MEASQRGGCIRVVVDSGETFPGGGVGRVKRGFPDASLEAIERGHVDAPPPTPDVEAVGAVIMHGGCADAGLWDVGKCAESAECEGGIEVEDVERVVDGDAWPALARIKEETAGVCDGGAVGGAGGECGEERPADGHGRSIDRSVDVVCFRVCKDEFPFMGVLLW